jgi:drug/metabolite transporter (DMT)-like permease
VEANTEPAAGRMNSAVIGVVCGAGAAFGWGAGFVAAKHGINIGFTPEDLAFHRFFWSGLLLTPVALREGLLNLGGFGWRRGLLMSVLAGPPQAMLAYSGFILVPLGHGTTIQPACAALFGLILATLMLHERATLPRIFGGMIIIAGLMVFGWESLVTIGHEGVGGDALFVTAGFFWAMFGTLLRHYRMSGTRAIAIVGVLSVLIYAPLYVVFVGFHNIMQIGLVENLVQIAVQGLLAGMLPIYLFARAVILLGAGRAATFPALVPGFGLVIGYLALGVIPSVPQLIGFVIVVIGFRFVVR